MRAQLWLVIACTAAFLWTAPGRIVFPDDEIVYQTTESLAERGSFAIRGIPFRTGEPEHRPDGTFGIDGPDGKLDGPRYSFFGHGLSVVALPAYFLGRGTLSVVPSTWTHATRSDLPSFHPRKDRAMWLRLVVSLTNCLLTSLGVWALVRWLTLVGFSPRSALWTGAAYALGTWAWFYAGTHLSEPLSALVLLLAAIGIARYHHDRDRVGLWIAAVLAGLSVHVHLINLIAVPCMLGYAVAPALRRGERPWTDRDLWIAVALGAAGLALLGLSHHLRFGSPFESGRFGHYSHWIAPWESLSAMLVGPGRSFFVYAPAALVGLVGFGAARRRAPDALWFAVALLATRMLFVALRSDWFGGWGLGPRYLVPATPFALVPLAALLDAPPTGRGGRIGIAAGLTLAILVNGWLALHSTVEWMWLLGVEVRADGGGREELSFLAHWSPMHSPFARYAQMDLPSARALAAGDVRLALKESHLDVLPVGALRLAHLGHPSLWRLYLAILAIGVAACVRLTMLARALPAGRGRQ